MWIFCGLFRGALHCTFALLKCQISALFGIVRQQERTFMRYGSTLLNAPVKHTAPASQTNRLNTNILPKWLVKQNKTLNPQPNKAEICKVNFSQTKYSHAFHLSILSSKPGFALCSINCNSIRINRTDEPIIIYSIIIIIRRIMEMRIRMKIINPKANVKDGQKIWDHYLDAFVPAHTMAEFSRIWLCCEKFLKNLS